MSTFPQILQYGLPGLAAIIAFLAYRLLLYQSKKTNPSKPILTTIKAFMILGVILAIISFSESTVELVTGSKNQKVVHKLENQLTKANSQIAQLKDAVGSQETVSELEQQLTTAKAEIEKLKQGSAGQQRIAELKSELADARLSLKKIEQTTAAQRNALNRLVTDRLEQEIRITRGKLSNFPESERSKVQCALLRRAVFLHILDFESDNEILDRALSHLVNRGYSDLSSCKEEILSGFPDLMVVKLRWLEDRAIPALTEDIDKISRSAVQRAARAKVPLPKEFVVVDENEFGEPIQVVTDLARLKEEANLLKSLL